MPYTKTAWVDNTTPAINASNLNKIENAVFAASQFFNPKDSAYGAVGDGVTDDTTAIQNCSNAAMAVNGVVVFPPGTYVVSTITPANNFHWWAPSSSVTIQHKAGTYRPVVYYFNNSTLITNVSIEGIKFVGNGKDVTTTINGTQTIGAGGTLNVTSSTGFNVTYGNADYLPEPTLTSSVLNKIVAFTGVGTGTLTGCTAGTYTGGVEINQPADKDALYFGGVDGILIRSCRIENFFASGISLISFRNALIENNSIFTVSQVVNGRNAIVLTDTVQNPGVMQDFIVRGNTVDGSTAGGIVATDSFSVNSNFQLRGLIANNIVKNVPNWSGIDTESGYVEELVITGNIIRACSIGIESVESEGVYTGISNSNRIIISSNLIDSGPTLVGATGIKCTGTDLSFVGNIIRTSGTCITLGSAGAGSYNENVSIVGNTLQVRPNDLTTLPNGITILSTTRNCVISGNSFNRMNCQARGAQTTVTTLAVNNVTDWPSTGTIRVNGSATAVTYTSITQATRAGGGATINGLSAAVTVADGQLVHLNKGGRSISIAIGDDIQISGNTISNSPLSGVFLTNGVSRCAILNNTFLNCTTDRDAGTANQCCVCLDNSGPGSNSDNQVIGNIMQDPNAITGYGLRVLQGSNTQARDNYFNNGTASFSFAFYADTPSDITMDRGNRKGNTHVPNGGVSSQSVGAVTVVNIAHGLLTTPTVYSAVPANAAARDKAAPVFAVTADATNIIITYAAAFPTGPQTVNYAWTAYV